MDHRIRGLPKARVTPMIDPGFEPGMAEWI